MAKGQLQGTASVSNLSVRQTPSGASVQPQRVKANERVRLKSHASVAPDPLRLAFAPSPWRDDRKTGRHVRRELPGARDFYKGWTLALTTRKSICP
jgi:hypothetical protein